MKNLKTIISFLFLAVLNLVSISCSRDSVNAVNELGDNKTEDVIEKGHDNWAKVKLSLEKDICMELTFMEILRPIDPYYPPFKKLSLSRLHQGLEEPLIKGIL